MDSTPPANVVRCVMRISAASLLGFVAVIATSQLLLRAHESAQSASGSPTFTAAQAALGETAYIANCAQCHGSNLGDGAFGPPLKGTIFVKTWGGKSVDELYTVTSTTMPTTAPASLDAAVYAQIVAYILQQNAVPPGTEELPSDSERLKQMIVPAGH